ncbi:MAG TPA: hypothetical protein VJ044_04510 [Candidatus Hodarchaeales archaeon]|nr:hypothetical protein [Candidatus Hodarchaeales archaeon]
MSVDRRLKELIDRLMSRSAIEAVAIATASDGLIIAGNFIKEEESEAVAALVGSLAKSVLTSCQIALKEPLISFHLTTAHYDLEIVPDAESGLLLISKISKKHRSTGVVEN